MKNLVRVLGSSVVALLSACAGDVREQRREEPEAIARPFALEEVEQPSKVAHIARVTARECIATLEAGGDPAALSSPMLQVRATGEIELSVHAVDPIDQARTAQLQGYGATISQTFDLPPAVAALLHTGMVTAWIPCSAVEDLASIDWVAAVTTPSYAKPNNHPFNPPNAGAFISEGVALHQADIAQQQGITGAGVTIGVISTGVTNIAAAIASNDVPAGVTVFNTGTQDEGTAMLEIVHDMAPNATLLYDDGTGTSTQNDQAHVNAIVNLALSGAQVVAEDLRFDDQPAFQQGLVAFGREFVASTGVSVHSSSGNRGANHSARVPAVGTGNGPDGVFFATPPPGCLFAPNNVVALNGADTTFDVVLGNAGFTLQWSEPRAVFPTVGQGGFTNLDLIVMDAGLTTCLGESAGGQTNGVGDTIEQVAVNSPGTPAKLIVNVRGTSSAVATPLLDLRWGGTQLGGDPTVAAGSIDPDKNYVGFAWSIGAVFQGNGNLEASSSQGPVTLLQTTVCPGGAAGPCTGVAGSALQNFQGLDFLGADGVTVTGAGGFGAGTCPAGAPGQCQFFGTSAAAPHTAACDALVRELLGGTPTLAQVRARLASTAQDFGPAGEDTATGAGLVDCFEALGPPTALCAPEQVPTDPGVCMAAVASIDNGSFDPFDPNGAPAVTLAQDPAGPYPLGGTDVDLTVTDNDGLFKECTAKVTVVDQEDPVFTLVPPPITVTDCTAPDLGTATATDNCGVTVTNNAPAKFPLGTTTVTWTAKDAAGNDVTATQIVTAVLGDDPSCCPLGTNIIVGNASGNLIIGTNGSDCILGLGGNDRLYGRDGVDFISGGAGNDAVDGDRHDDYLVGGIGDDYIEGDSGNDSMFGGEGRDTLNANDGADLCDGGPGNDDLDGDSGNDTLRGGSGNDELEGDSGTDLLQGNDGDDRLFGGSDDDVLDGGPNTDFCSGGLGNDTELSCE